MKRIISLLLCSVIFCTANADPAPPWATDSPPATPADLSSDVVRIGTPLYAPPFVVEDKFEGVQGFDIDMMKLICTNLKWKCKFISMPRISIFSALQANTIDYAIGGLVITGDRQLSFIFSQPYLPSEGGYIVLAGSTIQTEADLKGKKIGAIRYRIYYPFLLETLGNESTILPFDSRENLVEALSEGKIDAIGLNYLTGLFLQHQYPERIRALKIRYTLGKGIGIASMPANAKQMAEINKLLIQFQSDGTFIKLYNYNFGFFTQPTSS